MISSPAKNTYLVHLEQDLDLHLYQHTQSSTLKKSDGSSCSCYAQLRTIFLCLKMCKIVVGLAVAHFDNFTHSKSICNCTQVLGYLWKQTYWYFTIISLFFQVANQYLQVKLVLVVQPMTSSQFRVIFKTNWESISVTSS